MCEFNLYPRIRVVIFCSTFLLLLVQSPRVISAGLVNYVVIHAVQESGSIHDLDLVKKALTLNPEARRACYYTGIRHIEENDYVKAVKMLECASGDFPYLDPLTGVSLGKAYYAMGNVERALSVWKRAGSDTYFVDKGNSKLESRNFQEGLSDFRLALQIDPYSIEAYLGIGKCLRALGRYEEAIQVLKEALQFAPQSFDIHEQIFRVYNALGDWGAKAEWDERTAEVVSAERAHLYRGRAALWRGETTEAISELEIYITHRPQDHYGYLLLCNLYLKIDDFTSAVSACRKRIEMSPSSAPAAAYVRLGDAYLGNGDIQSARQAYLKALRLEPKNSEARGRLEKLPVDQ